MNPEDTLRRASQEMDRVTASVTVPPLEQLRHSARTRGIGMALASAVAVLVLIGGAVLLFDGSGATTLQPAEPGQTTATTETSQEALFLADSPLPLPPIPLDASDELVFRTIDDATRAADLSLLRNESYLGPFVGDVEIVVIGQMGTEPDDPRVYEVNGEYGEGADASSAVGREGGCYVFVQWHDTPESHSCWVGEAPLYEAMSGYGGGSFVYGEPFADAGPDVSVVTFEWGSEMKWQRVRGGYFSAEIPTRDYDELTVTAYDSAGNVVYRDPGNSGSAVTTTTAVPASSCSAGDLAPSALALSSIPQPVAQTLGDIVSAARECDFDRLEALGGDNFNASFGGDDPSTLWTMQEENGEQPMYALMRILDMPYGTIDLGDELLYVWPSAAAFDGPWDELPEADRQALLSLYTEEDLQSFADFGGYYGYRIGITASGDWSFFVAGD